MGFKLSVLSVYVNHGPPETIATQCLFGQSKFIGRFSSNNKFDPSNNRGVSNQDEGTSKLQLIKISTDQNIIEILRRDIKISGDIKFRVSSCRVIFE